MITSLSALLLFVTAIACMLLARKSEISVRVCTSEIYDMFEFKILTYIDLVQVRHIIKSKSDLYTGELVTCISYYVKLLFFLEE